MTFRKSLEAIKDEDSPRGDFASDFVRDSRAKEKRFKSWDSLESYLIFRKACPEAIKAAKHCWKVWKES